MVKGRLSFKALYDGRSVKDWYDIEMLLPAKYPCLPPRVREIGNKISRDIDYHVSEDGILCLGADLAVLERFYERADLLWFVDELVVPHLASCTWRRNGEAVPWEQLRHKGEGLLEFYKDRFGTDDNFTALRLLKVLVDHNYKGHTLCPCESGIKLRHCHGDVLKDASKYPVVFSREYCHIFELLKDDIEDIGPYVPRSIRLRGMRRRRVKGR